MWVVSAYNASSIRLSCLGQVEEKVERCSSKESKTSHAGMRTHRFGFVMLRSEARKIVKKQ